MSEDDFLSALVAEAGGKCPICAAVHLAVQRSIHALISELVNDPPSREQWRRSGGFCRAHGALLQELGAVCGTAILYEDLARLKVEAWRCARRRPRRAPRCMACEWAGQARSRTARALATAISENASQALRVLSGAPLLCVEHVDATVEGLKEPEASAFLSWTSSRLEELRRELAEVVRKSDYRFRHEPWGPERDACCRALEALGHS